MDRAIAKLHDNELAALRVKLQLRDDDIDALKKQLRIKETKHYAPDLVEIAALRAENKLLEERYGDCDDSRLAICKDRDTLRARCERLEESMRLIADAGYARSKGDGRLTQEIARAALEGAREEE